MNQSQMIEKLNDLIALDYDAVGAYQAAIDRVDVESIRSRLLVFQGDHRRHIQDLSGQCVPSAERLVRSRMQRASS